MILRSFSTAKSHVKEAENRLKPAQILRYKSNIFIPIFIPFAYKNTQNYANICHVIKIQALHKNIGKARKYSIYKELKTMIRILFICHGNICRSISAEYILKDLVRKRGRETEFFIDSAATSTEEVGNPIYPPMRQVLK